MPCDDCVGAKEASGTKLTKELAVRNKRMKDQQIESAFLARSPSLEVCVEGRWKKLRGSTGEAVQGK